MINEPLTSRVTPVKAVHVVELRQAIGAVRSQWGFTTFDFGDAMLMHEMTIRARHLMDLRQALNDVFDAAGQPRPAFTDPEIIPRVTSIRTVHVQELRHAVRTQVPGATVGGVDRDRDGLRDDVQDFILHTYSTAIPTQQAVTRVARAFQAMILVADDRAAALNASSTLTRELDCLMSVLGDSEATWQIFAEVRARTLSTRARSEAYMRANEHRSGTVLRSTPAAEQALQCNP